MIAYHGSNHNFKTLKISSSLVRYTSTLENEGMGIYFSTDRAIASGYGKYLYTLEINDKYIRDFRRKSVCDKYVSTLIQYIYKETKINISKYIDIVTLTKYMNFGGISIYNLNEEVNMLLDSSEAWHIEIPEYKRRKVVTLARRFDKNMAIAYMFNYTIKNVGVLKRVDSDVVRIVNKEIL